MNATDIDVLDTRSTKPEWPERPAADPEPAPRYSIGRAAALLFLVLGLQLGFVAALIGAQHAAPADNAPVAVVAGDSSVAIVAGAVATATTEYDDRHAALEAVNDRMASAALVPDGTGGTELRLAGSDTKPAARVLIQAYNDATRTAGVHGAVFDDYSPSSDNTRNLVTFYLVVGWVAGGFLAATGLAIALGAVPASERRTHARLLALLAYSLVSGISGSLVAGPALGAGTGYGLALATFGAMIAFGAAMTAAALEGWFGLLGAAAAIGLFLVLGNTGDVLGNTGDLGFLKDTQDWGLTGVGTELVRSTVSFGGGDGGVPHLIALWVYCFGGAVAFLVAGHVRPGRR